MMKTKMTMIVITVYQQISTTSTLDLKKTFLIIDERREEKKKTENDPSLFCLDHLFVTLMKKPKENDCSDISLSFTSCFWLAMAHPVRKREETVYFF